MTPTLVSVAEYLATSYRPDREYIDGIVEERHLGEYGHANLQSALLVWFRNRQREWNIRVVVEQRVRLSPTRFRVPDVTVLRRDQAVEQILTCPPLIDNPSRSCGVGSVHIDGMRVFRPMRTKPAPICP
jgi:hypothetical protein